MIRVAVVDDDPLVRAGLRLMLGGAEDIEIVGEAADGDEVAALVAGCRPEVVLIDIRMPRVDGIRAMRAAGAGENAPAFIVLTTFRTDGVVLDALRAGAAGFLLKHTPPEEIVAAVRLAAEGRPTVSTDALKELIEHVAGTLPAESGRAQEARAALGRLSERERAVADAVAEGLSNGEIADRLYLSLGSVKAHLSSALATLGLENRTQLAILAHDART